jgi:proline-specific peptidase
MRRHEAAGTTSSPEYQKAYAVYKKQHLFRGDVFPGQYHMADEKEGLQAYHKLWGASEAWADGLLKDWDKIDALPNISLPTLITSGQYDELTPWQAAVASNQLPNAELRIFTNGSHCVHIEQEAEYLSVLKAFLGKYG